MIYKLIFLIVCSSLISFIHCEDEIRLDNKCAENEKCVDSKIYDTIEKIDNAESVPLIGGLEIIKLSPEIQNVATSSGRDLGWWDWIDKYVQNHALRYVDIEYNPGVEEARTKKLKKFMLPLLILLKLKLALILPTILSTIALIAIKGLFAGVIALILSGTTFLKGVASGKQDKITAIVAPIPTDILKHHSDYGNRWSRISQDVQASASSLLPQSAGSSSNLLTQAYAPDPSLDPYNAYAPYPTIINPN